MANLTRWANLIADNWLNVLKPIKLKRLNKTNITARQRKRH